MYNYLQREGLNKPIGWFAKIATFPHQLVSCSMHDGSQMDQQVWKAYYCMEHLLPNAENREAFQNWGVTLWSICFNLHHALE